MAFLQYYGRVCGGGGGASLNDQLQEDEVGAAAQEHQADGDWNVHREPRA